MPARHRRSTVPGRRPRRQLVWCTQDVTSTVATNTAGNLDLLSTFGVAGSSTLGITIMRTIVTLQIPYALATDTITWGLIVGRGDDVGTNRPDPLSFGDDWMFNRREWIDTTGAAFAAGELQKVTYDVRSKRKLSEQNQRYLFSWHNNSAGNKTISIFVRTLLALP
jgi:hypothetical protein